MSDIVQWFKTGERGARAEFTDSDLLTTLLLISEEPMGRYKLQEELQLSDSSTKSLLNYCKKKDFLKIISNRKGHSLTQKGSKIVKLIRQIIIQHGICEREFFKNKQHYYTIFTIEITNDETLLPSWRIRDFALAYGADSILLIKISSQNEFAFPEDEIALEQFYPELENYFKQKVKSSDLTDNFLLITTAPTLEVARKSAVITALMCNKFLFEKIQNELLLE